MAADIQKLPFLLVETARDVTVRRSLGITVLSNSVIIFADRDKDL
jgi:hypothetical protein